MSKQYGRNLNTNRLLYFPAKANIKIQQNNGTLLIPNCIYYLGYRLFNIQTNQAMKRN